jgi:hypothetical protein
MTERLWMSSTGTRYSLICGAYTKYCLETLKLSPAEQLEMVEDLVKLQTGDVTKQAMKELKPFDGATAAMVAAAMDLPPKPGRSEKTSAGFDVLTGPSWGELCRLNPSLDRALKLCIGHYYERAA